MANSNPPIYKDIRVTLDLSLDASAWVRTVCQRLLRYWGAVTGDFVRLVEEFKAATTRQDVRWIVQKYVDVRWVGADRRH
jgi:hypothetical protein